MVMMREGASCLPILTSSSLMSRPTETRKASFLAPREGSVKSARLMTTVPAEATGLSSDAPRTTLMRASCRNFFSYPAFAEADVCTHVPANEKYVRANGEAARA